MIKKCRICKQEIIGNKRIQWGKGEIHLKCYSQDKQVDYDIQQRVVDYSGERSPYWEWVDQKCAVNPDGLDMEPVAANPDVLPEEGDYQRRRAYYQDIIEKTLKSLSTREKMVWNLLAADKTEQEIAAILKISRNTIHTYRQRIEKKFSAAVNKEAV